jgi:hypothetical protein
MWERFTERVRRIVFFAQEAASAAGTSLVTSEHLLLGLIRESDCVASKILAYFNISTDQIRKDLIGHIPPGSDLRDKDMELDPSGKKIVDDAHEEMRTLSTNYIGTEHLLLALISNDQFPAGKVLADLGLILENVRAHVRAMNAEDDSRVFVPPTPIKPFTLQVSANMAKAIQNQVVTGLYVPLTEETLKWVQGTEVEFSVKGQPPLGEVLITSHFCLTLDVAPLQRVEGIPEYESRAALRQDMERMYGGPVDEDSKVLLLGFTVITLSHRQHMQVMLNTPDEAHRKETTSFALQNEHTMSDGMGCCTFIMSNETGENVNTFAIPPVLQPWVSHVLLSMDIEAALVKVGAAYLWREACGQAVTTNSPHVASLVIIATNLEDALELYQGIISGKIKPHVTGSKKR